MSIKVPVVFESTQEAVLDVRTSSKVTPAFRTGTDNPRPVGLVRYEATNNADGTVYRPDEDGNIETITINKRNEFHYIGMSDQGSEGAWLRMLPVGTPATYWTDYVDENLVDAKVLVETNDRTSATDTTGLVLNKEARDRMMKVEAKSLFVKTSDFLSGPPLTTSHGVPTSLDKIQGQHTTLVTDDSNGINRDNTLDYAQSAYDSALQKSGLYQAKELIPISVDNSLVNENDVPVPIQWATETNFELARDKRKYLLRLGEMNPTASDEVLYGITEADDNPYTGQNPERLQVLNEMQDVGFLVYDRAEDIVQTETEIETEDTAKKTHQQRRLSSSLLSAGAMVEYAKDLVKNQKIKLSPYLGASEGGWDFNKVGDDDHVKVFDMYEQPTNSDGTAVTNANGSINRDYLKFRLDNFAANQEMITTINTERANGLSDPEIQLVIQNLYPDLSTAPTLADNETNALTRQSFLAEAINGSLLTAGVAYQLITKALPVIPEAGMSESEAAAMNTISQSVNTNSEAVSTITDTINTIAETINTISGSSTDHENNINLYLEPGMYGVHQTVFGSTYYQQPDLPENSHPEWPFPSSSEAKLRNAGGVVMNQQNIVEYGLIDQMRLLTKIIGYPVPQNEIVKRITEDYQNGLANGQGTPDMINAGLSSTSSYGDIEAYVQTEHATMISAALPKNALHEEVYMRDHVSMFDHFNDRINQVPSNGPAEKMIQVWLRSDDGEYEGPFIDPVTGATISPQWGQVADYSNYRRVFVYFGDLLKDVIGWRDGKEFDAAQGQMKPWNNKLFSSFDNDQNWSNWDYTIQLTSGGRNDRVDTSSKQHGHVMYRNKAPYSFEILIQKRDGDEDKDNFEKIDFTCTSVTGLKAAGTIWINANGKMSQLGSRLTNKKYNNTGYYRILGGDNGNSGAQPILSAAEKYAYMSHPALRSFGIYGNRHERAYSYLAHRAAFKINDFERATLAESEEAMRISQMQDAYGGAATIDFRHQYRDESVNEAGAEDMQHFINMYLTSPKPHRVPILKEEHAPYGTWNTHNYSGIVERQTMDGERLHMLSHNGGNLWP
jgi:hypothetical protein